MLSSIRKLFDSQGFLQNERIFSFTEISDIITNYFKNDDKRMKSYDLLSNSLQTPPGQYHLLHNTLLVLYYALCNDTKEIPDSVMKNKDLFSVIMGYTSGGDYEFCFGIKELARKIMNFLDNPEELNKERQNLINPGRNEQTDRFEVRDAVLSYLREDKLSKSEVYQKTKSEYHLRVIIAEMIKLLYDPLYPDDIVPIKKALELLDYCIMHSAYEFVTDCHTLYIIMVEDGLAGDFDINTGFIKGLINNCAQKLEDRQINPSLCLIQSQIQDGDDKPDTPQGKVDIAKIRADLEKFGSDPAEINRIITILLKQEERPAPIFDPNTMFPGQRKRRGRRLRKTSTRSGRGEDDDEYDGDGNIRSSTMEDDVDEDGNVIRRKQVNLRSNVRKSGHFDGEETGDGDFVVGPDGIPIKRVAIKNANQPLKTSIDIDFTVPDRPVIVYPYIPPQVDYSDRRHEWSGSENEIGDLDELIHHCQVHKLFIPEKRILYYIQQLSDKLSIMHLSTAHGKLSSKNIHFQHGDMEILPPSTCPLNPFFLAPELFSSGQPDKYADSWSLGILIYYLATLNYPFILAEELTNYEEGKKDLYIGSFYSGTLLIIIKKLLKINPRSRGSAVIISLEVKNILNKMH